VRCEGGCKQWIDKWAMNGRAACFGLLSVVSARLNARPTFSEIVAVSIASPRIRLDDRALAVFLRDFADYLLIFYRVQGNELEPH
jgi:hypothetical protein